MTDPVVIQVALAPRVLKAQFAAATGLTVKAIERKIEDGKWLEGTLALLVWGGRTGDSLAALAGLLLPVLVWWLRRGR